jgi:hypothetical protein
MIFCSSERKLHPEDDAKCADNRRLSRPSELIPTLRLAADRLMTIVFRRSGWIGNCRTESMPNRAFAHVESDLLARPMARHRVDGVHCGSCRSSN